MSATFDLREYAQRHRLRLRNLHDGGPVPPAKKVSKGRQVFTGDDDRWDAIVGRRGYVAMDGDRLSVYAHYPSVRAKTCGMRTLVEAGVVVQQDGDTEIGGWAPVERIEDVLAAIRVIRIRRSTHGFSASPPGRAVGAADALEPVVACRDSTGTPSGR